MGLSDRYNLKQIAAAVSEIYRKPAVIVDVVRQYDGKFDDTPPDIVTTRYRIRILGEDPADKPIDKLPLAYPLALNDGRGSQDVGIIKYAINSYVYVSQDVKSGAYFIERSIPNNISKLHDDDGFRTGVLAQSGYSKTDRRPDNNTLKGKTTHELHDTIKAPSKEDKKTVNKSKAPKIKDACEKVNVEGINDAILNMIKDIENLRTGLLGDDSLLATTENFLNDAEDFVLGEEVEVGNQTIQLPTGNFQIGNESHELTLGNAAGDIAKIVAAIVQEIRKWTLRKATSVANNALGGVPLASRYAANEIANETLNTLSCLFVKILKNLETIIANILKTIVNKILNVTECLLENIIGGIIGNIIGNIAGAVQSILSKLGSLFESLGSAIESVTDFIDDMLDFAIDILDIFICDPKNLCPDTSTWDFVSGAEPADLPNLNFKNIFNKAKNTVGSVSAAADDLVAVPVDIFDEVGDIVDRETIIKGRNGSVFEPLKDFNAGDIWQNVIDGTCNTGAVNCGPPKVVFFGGDGYGGTGNARVNALGQIIGVDIVTPGNYKKAPLISFQDSCGKGQGAVGKVKIKDKPKDNKIPKFEKTEKPGAIVKFELWENYKKVTNREPGFYEKLVKQDALSIYGSVLWEELSDFVEGTVPLSGGSGKGFEATSRFEAYRGSGGKAGNTAYSIQKIVNAGEGYKIGDILKFPNIKGVNISEGSNQDQFLLRVLDVTPPADEDETQNESDKEIDVVVMEDTGYGYEGFPYGDKGGGGRVWADRCQTIVQRANYDWDIPYSKGRVISLYYGDTITFPGENPIVIDANFTESMIPGCIISGTNPKIKDMTKFDYKRGITYKTGIKHQFGWAIDAQNAFSEGYTEQDIRFFIENKFFLRIGPKMREKMLDPEWGKISEFSVTLTVPGCPPGTPEDPNEPPSSPEDGKKQVSQLQDIDIGDGGNGYSDDDELIIGDGTNGSGKIITDPNGSIIRVDITNPGIGFTTLPEITINTQTGFNAQLTPVLQFIDVDDSGFDIPFGTPVLQVIDCVGKV